MSLCVRVQVTVHFTGRLGARGFSQGRVSASLVRSVAGDDSEQTSTRHVGFAPHSRQKLNQGDEFHQTPGTIFIQHSPRLTPLISGLFQVVVKAFSFTCYSVKVVAGQCESCASLTRKRMTEAQDVQVSLVYFRFRRARKLHVAIL